MKKYSVIILILAIALSIVACKSRPDGINGGSEGNGIFSGNNDKQYRNKIGPVKAVMVDGYLYYETGEDNDISGRNGRIDGNLTKTVDKYELPKNNNETNFEIKNKNYAGYQLGMMENTIEVPIGDDWEIFRKLYDPEKDLTTYKYIVEVEGDTQYEFGDAEYIVLTNNLEITANDVAKSELSSDSKDRLDIYIVERDLD